MTVRTEVIRDPAIMNGAPSVSGTHILASNILDYLRQGSSAEEIFRDYPSERVDNLLILKMYNTLISLRNRSVVYTRLGPRLRTEYRLPSAHCRTSLEEPPGVQTAREPQAD